MRPNTARFRSNAGMTPKLLTMDVAGNAGSANHQSTWCVAINEPQIKKNSVTNMRALPPPTVNRVPDAQPPPNCMPMPKMNAPNTTDTPAGATSPTTGRPNNVPAPSAGKNNSTATASITICARKPAPRRSLINTRQAEVKPKAAWYKVKPSAAPTTSNNTWRGPTLFCRNTAPTTRTIKATSGAKGLRAGVRGSEVLMAYLSLFESGGLDDGKYKPRLVPFRAWLLRLQR